MDVVIIQIVIGLVLAFSLLSVVVSQGIELVRITLNGRSRFLYKQMKKWFYNTGGQWRELLVINTDFPFLNNILKHPLLDVVNPKSSTPDLSDVNITRNDSVDKKLLSNVIIQNIVNGQTLPANLQEVLKGLGINSADLFINNIVAPYIISGKPIPEEYEKILEALQLTTEEVTKNLDDKLGLHLKDYIGKLDEIKVQLDEFKLKVQADVVKTEKLMEAWIDKQFDTMSKVFQRQQYFISLAVALVLAMILNIDSIQMSIILWKDPTLRNALVEVAGNISAEQSIEAPTSSSGTDLSNISGTTNVSATITETDINIQISQTKLAIDELLGSSLPIGWTCGPWDSVCEPKETSYFGPGQDLRSWQDIGTDWRLFVMKLIGWIITAVAVSLGQDFWFNLLRKLAQRDSSGGAKS